MGRRIAIWIVLACGSLTTSASTLTVDDYLVAARSALFGRTETALQVACDIFDVAMDDIDCPDCRKDREMVFLHAVAQTARLFVDHNDLLATDDFFQLAQVLGIPLDGIVFCTAQTEGANDAAVTKDANPEDLREELEQTILPQLATIVAKLDSIEDQPDPFLVYLVPEETGLAGDLEIDYGDVLIFKGLLLAYRGFLGTELAQGTDAGDWSPKTVQEYIEATAGGQDPTGFLAEAREDWIEALDCTLAAAESIAEEDCPAGTDPQEDEFVYVDREDQSRLDTYRRMLASLRGSLLDGSVETTPSETVRAYDLCTADSTYLGTLILAFDDLHGTEGKRGRLLLAAGDQLDVDWFGGLDSRRIGISLFSGSQNLQGWFEVTLDDDRQRIEDGTLDLWGTRSITLAGLAGQAIETDTQGAVPEKVFADGAVKSTQQPDDSEDWDSSWVEPTTILALAPDAWFAFGHANHAIAAN